LGDDGSIPSVLEDKMKAYEHGGIVYFIMKKKKLLILNL